MRNRILNHDLFIEYLEKIRLAEANRIFCLHNLNHFLDVARIGMIIRNTENIEVEEELIYAAALLHDIGKIKQYENGIPHEVSSAQIAEIILSDCGVDNKTTHVITDAIRTHRMESVETERNLNGVLYRADKMSRSCFACDAKSKCSRKEQKRNNQLQY